MAYYQIEDFIDYTKWQKVFDGDTFYDVTYTDWPEYSSDGVKETQAKITFLEQYPLSESYVYRKFSSPFYFKYRDSYGKFFSYDSLFFITRFISGFGTSIPNRFLSPSDFIFTFAIYNEGILLREWFVPIHHSSCCYELNSFDLKPLIDAGKDRFDEIRIGIIGEAGVGSSLYLGDIFLFENDVQHNLQVTLAKDLHMHILRDLTVISEPASIGDKSITVASMGDIHERTPLLIGDPNGVFELHIAQSAPYESDGRGTVTFTGEYDTEALQYAWPEGTPVYYTVPAEFGDIQDKESPFPLFYISAEPAEVEETMAKSAGGTKLSSYVRDDINGHTVGASYAVDSVRIPVSIDVYASNTDESSEMWKVLREKFDNQSHISIAGITYDYEIVGTSAPSTDEDDTAPHYIMDLMCYPQEMVHKLTYFSFPAIKQLTFDGILGSGALNQQPQQPFVEFTITLDGNV